MFWGPVTQVEVLKDEVPDVGSKPLLLRERRGVLNSLLVVGHSAGDGVYGEIVSQPLLPISMWFFFLFP